MSMNNITTSNIFFHNSDDVACYSCFRYLLLPRYLHYVTSVFLAKVSCMVRSKARDVLHLQFEIYTNALETRAAKSPKCYNLMCC
jgi:hypothetical protein